MGHEKNDFGEADQRVKYAMLSEYPFVYIAALMRTGSTLLQEALTQIPVAFIFHEPHIAKNYMRLHDNEVIQLSKHGVDLVKFTHWRLHIAFLLRRLRFFGLPQDYMVRQFKEVLMPLLFNEQRAQIGVKEIRNTNWQNYAKHFPQMKVLLTARDPRDIYISSYWKSQREGRLPQGLANFEPTSFAKMLRSEFEKQIEMYNSVDTMRVRYEDFCSQPHIYEDVKHFVNSPISQIGEIGKFISSHPLRSKELAELNEPTASIKTHSVSRWRHETDKNLLANAHVVLEFMPDYCSFWGYPYG